MPIQGITPNYFEDIKSRDDIGVPGESPYIPNGDEPIEPQETGDAASVDGSSSSSQPGSTTPMSGDYDSGYIENSDEYNNSVGHATDSLDNAEATVDDMFAGINDSDYISDAGNGYQSVNGDKLAKLLVFLNLLTNAQMALKMVLDSQDELSSKLHEILFDIQAEEGADEATASAKERMFKNAKEKLKIVQQFISSLYKKVYNHNLQVYQQRMREIEKEKEDRAWYDDVGNYFSGGQQDIDNEKKKLEATRQYGDAVGANMRALEQALMTMAIVFEQMNTPEGRQMGKQLESMAKQIKYIMEGALSRRADWQSDYYDGAGMDFFYDSLMNFRGKMVQTENLYRALAYMQSAQQEISDSVRETVLEISPHASKLQYRMIASEGLFGMANMFFDNAYNTLQMKVKAFNTEVQICKNIKKLEEAQGWKIASVGLQVVAVALAIVASVLSFGALAAPATIAVVSLCSALAGLGAAGLNSVGSAVAAGVDDSYDVNNPNYRVSDNINLTKHKKPSEVIDEAEQAENEIISQMGGAGLLEQTQDGYWNLNSRALAAFEIRQQSLHNLVKMIAFLKKAQRDLNRAIMGIVLEKAIKDHGEGYLLSNIENSIHQRQMMMQAIKFQLQEQVTGRNIARQNEIMASKAIWSSTAGIIGAVGCAALAAIPGAGGLSVVPAFMSIGAAVGSSLYNYIESHSKSSGYGMNYESHSEEFSRLMAERKKTATEAKIAEDKLYQMENAAYEELLANGSVGTGDGYTGVNYTAVGKAYQQMLSIQNIRQYLMELRNAQIRQSASTRRQVLGISTSETTDLSGIVAQRGLSQAMAIVAAITRMLSDKSAVQNRARDAQKQARMATFSLVANVSIAGVGMGMGYSPNALGIGKTAADVSRNVTPGLMGLVNATGSLIMNALWARDDYGAYNNYSSDKAVKEIRGNRRQKTEQDTFDKLAALEDQVFQEMGENIVQSMDAGVGSVNGEITGILNTRMHAINNLRKSLLILMSARDQFSQAIRRKVGVGGGPIADANELASPQERIAQQILNSLTQGVQTLLERQNQISQYERQQFIGSVSVVLSAASVALGAIAAVKGSQAEKVQETINDKVKTPEANPQAQPAANSTTAAPTQTGQTPTQPTAQPAGTPQGARPTTASARPNAPAGQSRPTVGTAQVPGTPTPPARNVEGLDPAAKAKNLRELTAQRDALSNSARHYQLASGSVALVNTFWNFYGGVLVFDPAQEEKKSSVSNSKLDVVRDGQTAKKSSALQTSSSSSSDSGGGIYESTGANEADALQSEVMISSYSSPTAANIALQRAEQMISTWQSGIQQGAGTAVYLKSQDKPIILPENQRGAAIPGELAEGSRINLNSGTIEQTYSIVKDHSDPVAFVKTEVDQGRLHRDRATILLNRLETERPELKPQIDQVRASLAAAVSHPAPAQPGRPATPYQQDTSSTASRSRALIAHADELLSHQQTRATSTSTQVTAVQVDVRNISTQLVDVDTQVQTVQAKIPNATGSEHTSLEQQLSALKQRRDQLVTLFNDKVREVNRLETQIRALRTTSTTEIDQEIAALEQLKRDVNIPPQEVRDIDAKINMLRQARPQREREIQQSEQRLAQVKQEISQIKGQLTQINQHIAQVQRELEKEKEKTSKRELDSDDKKSASATAGVRGSVVRAVGNLGNGRGNGGNGQGNGYKDRADQLQEEEDKVLASTNHGSTIGGLS